MTIEEYFCKGSEQQLIKVDETFISWPQCVTYPEFTDILFTDVNPQLPLDCKHLLCKNAVLAHPYTKRVFGIGWGTTCIAFNVPDSTLKRVLGYNCRRYLENLDGIYADLRNFEDNWIFCFDVLENINDVLIPAFKKAEKK